VSYLGSGLWQRNAFGGYQYQVNRIGVPYRGTFWGVNYGFRLHHGIAVSYSYQGYVTDTGQLVIKTRNLAQFSITWTHNEGQIFQKASY